MKVYRKEWSQLLPLSLEEAWDYFSKPENLDTITPDDLSFEILTNFKGKRMYPGMMIMYRVSPFTGVKMNWCTEISHVHEPHYFVDEQRTGPYSMWHHEHHFEEVEGGTVVKLKEYGYEDTEEGHRRCLECATGWGEALTLLKFYVEHGITY